MKTSTGTDLNAAAKYLREGELVAIPTETVYGLAGNGFLDSAISDIFSVKQRPLSDPLILHTNHPDNIRKWTIKFSSVAEALFNAFSPGPLTVILPKNPVISDKITAGLPDAAFRIPDHKLTLELLSMLNFPLAAPSANPFGYVSPTQPSHVSKQLSGKISYILDGGSCSIGIESTIVKVNGEKVKILRHGAITREMLEAVAGKKNVFEGQSGDGERAPGYMKSHYAPHRKLVTGNLKALIKAYENENVGIISFENRYSCPPDWPVITLSADGKTEEAGRNLFAAIREMDNDKKVSVILAEFVPDTGIGIAVNERLRKASDEVMC